jgi:bifunctional non-homologous end joining protein LigD
LMAEQHPDLVVSKMTKSLRGGKVFIDWSQNSDFKTTVGAYSLRAKLAQPFVSAPIEWEELAAAMKAEQAGRLFFKPDVAIRRLQGKGDLFEPLLSLQQTLPADFVKQFATRRSERVPSSLSEYSRKRDFMKTKEPEPAPIERSRQGSRRRFVIQKHAASHLHYDFRLEMHDALKSWAVPKGPPYSLSERRLAMPTEDHPLDYLDFEGVIPAGQYGGGTVMVWDIGTYELIEGNYYKGFLHFHLAGRKLKGEWQLTRAREKDRDVWFFARAGSAMRPISAKRDDTSAVSGRTMEQIRTAADAVWHSNRNQPDLSDLPKAKMQFIEPMLARLVQTVPEGATWKYEIKLDGYRTLAMKKSGEVILFSRRGNKMNTKFGRIATALKFLPDDTAVDGEVVALDEKGRPSFSALQNSWGSARALYFYAFDILIYREKDLRRLPLSERRNLLENFALPAVEDPIRISPSFDSDPKDLIKAVREQGLEGIVAKRTDSLYEPGERSRAWLKYKTNQGQELVIGGYKPSGQSFEYLLAGYYEDSKLMFVGKIKNGFVPAVRRQLMQHLKPLQTNSCPFANLPEAKNARRGEALTAEVMKKCRWLMPKLVAQIEFTEWTEDNHLRHSSFAGLRDDKDPREVIRERAA